MPEALIDPAGFAERPHRTARHGGDRAARAGGRPGGAIAPTTGAAHALRCPGPRARQRGLVFYGFVLMTLIVLFAVYGASALWRDGRTQRDQTTLQRTRDAILAHLAAPDLDTTGRRLGQFGLLPDLAFTGQGAGYTLCAYRTWVPGSPLVSVDASGAAARCFGRVPWLALGLDLGPVDSVDREGEIPWLIVSPNLVTTKACMPNLTPLVIGSAVANTCPGVPSQLPFPWITVVDERGNVLSNRVAFALIMPGAPTGGVARSATAGPGAWLDALTVLPGCAAPCNPGTYDNSAYQQANGTPTTLVTSNLSHDGLAHLPWLARPRASFNNRLLWVTVDELFRYLETRARQQLQGALASFRSAHAGVYPYAAQLGDTAAACASGVRFGHPPIADGSCGTGASLGALLPAWWTDAGWQAYFLYAASPGCVAANPGCGPPGLTLNGAAGINALLIGPGAPITAAPFAPSRGAPQVPLGIGYLSPSPADYVDSVLNAAGATTGIFAATTPGTQPDDDRLDIVQ
jgi:hypothetical protein